MPFKEFLGFPIRRVYGYFVSILLEEFEELIKVVFVIFLYGSLVCKVINLCANFRFESFLLSPH